jgi:hypothetical protein
LTERALLQIPGARRDARRKKPRLRTGKTSFAVRNSDVSPDISIPRVVIVARVTPSFAAKSAPALWLSQRCERTFCDRRLTRRMWLKTHRPASGLMPHGAARQRLNKFTILRHL